jgi:cation:H+ antiporter
MQNQGAWSPILFVALFIASALLMVWALEAMNAGGLEGTVIGTLITPYCTGIGNLLVAFVVGRDHGSGADVMTNCLVNNVTNMTLLIGLPAIIWTMNVMPQTAAGKTKKKKNSAKTRVHEINRLSLLLTLVAVLFFTGAVWALARDGRLDFGDGLVLVGLFLFWQLFHVYDVLKSNVQKNKSLDAVLLLYLAALVAAGYLQYLSIDWLNTWLSHRTGFLSAKNMGLLSGWLCALPNGLLAIYYGWRGNPEIVYTSQVGDGHICIPLCVGVFALFTTFHMPAMFQTGMYILIGATVVHMFCVVVFGQLPRLVGIALVVAYGYFLYRGLLQ